MVVLCSGKGVAVEFQLAGIFLGWLYFVCIHPLLCISGVRRLDKAHFMDILIEVIPSMAAYLGLREDWCMLSAETGGLCVTMVTAGQPHRCVSEECVLCKAAFNLSMWWCTGLRSAIMAHHTVYTGFLVFLLTAILNLQESVDFYKPNKSFYWFPLPWQNFNGVHSNH